MTNKDKTLELLKNYETNLIFCRNADARLALLDSVAETSSVPDLYAQEKLSLKRQRDSSTASVALIDNALPLLSEEEQRTIWHFFLHRRRGHVDALCTELCCEERQVYKYKEKAVQKITTAVYGI